MIYQNLVDDKTMTFHFVRKYINNPNMSYTFHSQTLILMFRNPVNTFLKRNYQFNSCMYQKHVLKMCWVKTYDHAWKWIIFIIPPLWYIHELAKELSLFLLDHPVSNGQFLNPLPRRLTSCRHPTLNWPCVSSELGASRNPWGFHSLFIFGL